MNNEKLALLAKQKEIEALQKANSEDKERHNYFSGKAQAFSEIWEYIVFDGRSVPAGQVHPQEYNRQNEIWSAKAITELRKRERL